MNLSKKLSKNYILVIDDVLTKKQCELIINKHRLQTKGSIKNSFSDCLYKDDLVFKQLQKCIEIYKNKYPACDITLSKWELKNLFFKHFKPKKHFKEFHSEHTTQTPYRMMGVIIFLSNHFYGTRFMDYGQILSIEGRVLIYPCYYTHTHQGEKPIDNKDRYIMTGYYEFI